MPDPTPAFPPARTAPPDDAGAAGQVPLGVLTVEDHYPQGGLGEAVGSELSETAISVHSLVVNKLPRRGKPQELMDYAVISAKAFAEQIRSILA